MGLLVSAALMGLIVAAMKSDGFPGWGPMVAVVFVTNIAIILSAYVLPDNIEFLSILVGAAAGAAFIYYLCDLSWRRSVIAAGIFFALRLAFFFIVA